ncbi:GFA family protein [Marinobacterium jannaschii]|uniref:GFA family protein n=1 Tax=Marinobacterium jannaschii TaxID=64970 RepID=UPI0004809CBF|nr:GFA family protein [Marinobacterium jannaschii]
MTDTREASGRCLCGACVLHAEKLSRHSSACHCSMCRKWGGGPLLAVECGTEVRFEGEEHIATYASSAWAERGFCSHCGTHLFYRISDNGAYIVPVGLFDDEADFELVNQIFIDEKPTFYDFANKTKMMTGAEVFAMYAPGGGAE